MNFTVIITQIIVLFIVIITGYCITKIGIIDDDMSKKISRLVINVTAPLLIISAMTKEVDLSFGKILMLLLIVICYYIFLIILTFFIPKLLRVKKGNIGVYKFMLLFSNNAFIGFPVVSSIFGEAAIFYAAIFCLPFNLLVFTLGVYYISLDQETEHQFEWKKLISPPVVAVVVGIVLFGFQVKLPMFIQGSIDMIGGMTTPLAMMVIGSSLTKTSFLKVIKDYRLVVLSIIKLLIIPVLFFLVLSQLGFTGLMIGVPVIISGMPVASNTVIVCKAYGGNDVLGSEGIFVSTILFLITIPILVFILM